jgi:hypothetical protein
MEFCTQTASVLSSSWLMMPKQLTLIHLAPPPTWLGQHFGLLRHNYAGVHYIPHSRAENFYPWQFSLSLSFLYYYADSSFSTTRQSCWNAASHRGSKLKINSTLENFILIGDLICIFSTLSFEVLQWNYDETLIIRFKGGLIR